MIIWGAIDTTGGSYNPSAVSAWTPTTITRAPLDRSLHTAVWTGREMIVFGGRRNSVSGLATNSAFSYIPPRTLYLYQRP